MSTAAFPLLDDEQQRQALRGYIAPFKATGPAAGLALPLVDTGVTLKGASAPTGTQSAEPANVSRPFSMPEPKIAPFSTDGGMPPVIPPRGTVEGDQAERGRRLGAGPLDSQIYKRITGSSFGQNHPVLGKVLGGLGQGIATLGDTALSTVAPELAVNIPGTRFNFNARLRGLNQQIAQESTEREKAAQTQAEQGRTGLEAAQTAAIPETQKRQLQQLQAGLAEHGLQMDEEGNITPVSEENLSPALRAQLQGQWKPVAGVAGPNGEPMEYNATNGSYRVAPGSSGASVVATDRLAQGNDFEQYYKQYLKDNNIQDSAENRLKAEAVFAAAKQPPQRPPQVTVMVPNANGGYQAQLVRPGETVAPGAVTAAGMNSMNVPTAATRSMVEKAPKVIDFVNRSLQLIDENEKQLGPLAGRWSEFTTGKIGLKNRGYTQLRTDLGLLETALMNMHVGARGGEQIMEHFHSLINGAGQDPDNLRAALEEIRDYAQRTEQEGKPGAGGAGNAGNQAGGAQGQQHKIGDKVKLNGKEVTIKKIYPDGTFDY